GVLILNPEFYLPDKKVKVNAMSEERLKFFALRLYVNHIGGLDVVHQHDTVTGLAKWSVDNLAELDKATNGDAGTLASAEAKWKRLRDDLQVLKKPGAYVIAPADPVSFVKDILVETMIYLRRYSEVERVFGTTDLEDSNVPSNLPLSLTYMQFNSAQVRNSSRPKELIVSAIRAAKSPANAGTARFQVLRSEAALLTDTGNLGEVKKWLLGQQPYQSEHAAYRWQLVMDFIEHAGSADWGKNWAKMRGNASLVRTQAQFYRIVFEEE
ncbi:MAG TPA: hypothetical protein VFS20_20350, partial [Longimicrobium sp.]|nr:hypothetical protein [Longimicrobium sp.]